MLISIRSVKRKEQSNNVKKVDSKKRACVFALKTIECIEGLDKKDFVVQILVKQLLHSAISKGKKKF